MSKFSNFKLTFDSDDEENNDKIKPSLKIIIDDDSNEEEDDYVRKYPKNNIFDDDEPYKKIPSFKSTAKPDSIKNEETNRYSSVVLNSYLHHTDDDSNRVKENSRSNSTSSNNDHTLKINEDRISYSTKTIVPPPQIGALRFNPAKIIEDSVRKSSFNNTNHSKPANNDSYFKDKNSSFNSDDSMHNSSEKTQKTLLRENLELKTTISKMTAELKQTTLKINDKPDCKLTIENFISNKNYTFDIYKNKRDKIRLLNEAISSHDGNAILAVVLFLKNSLFSEIFYGILISNPIALNQYVFYLEQMKYYSELADFYKFQGNSVESAMITYFRQIFSKNNKETNEKIYLDDYEKKSNATELKLVESSSIITHIRKHITLLSIQKEITNKNKSIFLRKDEVRQNAMDTLYKSSVSNTISFCLKYSKDLNENPIYSIENLKKEFDIQTKQFSIWFIKSMSEIGAWSALENFTKQRGIFNMVKSPPVSFETIVFIISKVEKGHPEQIKKYLSLVEDVERRQALAIKFKITDVVLETFKIQKDRVGLLNFRNTFREGSNDYIKANIILADDKIKWKN